MRELFVSEPGLGPSNVSREPVMRVSWSDPGPRWSRDVTRPSVTSLGMGKFTGRDRTQAQTETGVGFCVLYTSRMMN